MENNVLEIRRLTRQDEIMLCKYISTTDSDVWNRVEEIPEFLANEHNYYIVCIKDENIIGFLLGYELQRYDGLKKMVYVHEVEVDKEFRRQGIARLLFAEFKSVCIERRVMKAFLVTNESNAAAMALYVAEGGIHKEDDDVLFEFRKFE